MSKALDQQFLSSVSHSPGVYLMLDRKSNVLYVGKAKDLFKRLSTYVHYSGPAYSKTAVMLKQVKKIDTLITNTEKEALILESSLIKKHRPKYNVILRDDKSYPYIKVSVQEEWPRVFMTRRKKRDGSRYFGPYASSSAMWSTLKMISSLFPLRRCKGAKLKPRKRPCLNHQMNNCLAPCAGKANIETYREMVQNVLLFLEGKNTRLISDLKKQMIAASENLEFEHAAMLRDRISALQKTLEKQIIVSTKNVDRDVFGFCRKDASVSIALLMIRNGVIGGGRRFYLQDPYGDDSVILSQALSQMYDTNSPPPREVILPHTTEDLDILTDRFKDLAQSSVSLIVPQRGERKDLLNMATTNAKQLFEEREAQLHSWNGLAESLMKKLGLPAQPESIECLDISNTSGKQSVGSLVRFHQGEPDSKNYRHYRIKSKNTPDDYAMMREVLLRRFQKGIDEGNLPDLFMVDGGKGQLGIAEAAVKELGLIQEVSLVGIAKERQDEGEKLYRPRRKNPIILPPHNPVLLHLMRIRDEAHRFGITFHRKLRNKKSMASTLDSIPGVGPTRKKALLSSMGSIKNISRSSIEDLSQVKGVGPELAQVIYQYFKNS